NEARQQEEAIGLIRYLRPSIQNPDAGEQLGLDVTTAEATFAPLETAPLPWPDTLPARALALRQTLSTAVEPLTLEQAAARFRRARRGRAAGDVRRVRTGPCYRRR